MEAVVRAMTQASADRDTTLIVCDAGADDHGPFDVRTVQPSRLRWLRTWRVIRALRDWAPDYVEVHQHAHSAPAIARAMADIPTVLYRHNATPAPKTARQRARYDARYRPLAGLVFVSDVVRDQFAIDYPALAERAHAVLNPIDVAPWSADPAVRAPLIVFSGRALPEKGLDLLCQALPAVLERRPDWRVRLLLNDWHMHGAWAAPHLVPLQQFGARVEVLTNQPMSVVRQSLQAAAIAVVPSVWQEPFGLSAVEAHAAGAAVISSGRGGLRLASGPHALYVDPLTPEALGEAMDALIADPARRLALAREGQAYVAREHTPARRAAELDALRRRIVEGAASPP
ncbi:hypothetical protein BZG35_13870 [Brevundimonas sp. LM2]|nr:hypothetical protein BZG35_13870 [Brevundimonas sp. LM2]